MSISISVQSVSVYVCAWFNVCICVQCQCLNVREVSVTVYDYVLIWGYVCVFICPSRLHNVNVCLSLRIMKIASLFIYEKDT